MSLSGRKGRRLKAFPRLGLLKFTPELQLNVRKVSVGVAGCPTVTGSRVVLPSG